MAAERKELRDISALFRGTSRFFWVQCNDDGYAGAELWRVVAAKEVCVCTVIYWDAVGQYFLETLNGDVDVHSVLTLLSQAVRRVGVPFDSHLIDGLNGATESAQAR